MSNEIDAEIDTDVVEEINVPPNWPTTEELEEVIITALRPTPYSSEHGLKIHALVLKCEHVLHESQNTENKAKTHFRLWFKIAPSTYISQI